METAAIRRRIMQAVKSKNTTPELRVRRLLYAQGYRYRLHRRDLPGCPDLVFSRLRRVIFVNGCFWHGHECPRGARIPKTNTEYWAHKVARNRARDVAAQAELEALGWEVLSLWECELQDEASLVKQLQEFLGKRS